MMKKGDYLFYVEYDTGEVALYNGLTKRQAVIRYNKVARNQPADVKGYGWELIQDTLSQIMRKRRATLYNNSSI